MGDENKEKDIIKKSSEESDADMVEDCLGKAVDIEVNLTEIAISESEEAAEMYGNEEKDDMDENEMLEQNEWWLFQKQNMKMFTLG
ncbi:MAG: hypothetical protein Ta2E_10800 [Mycoplasmoidaceae bacterium]|nr:MAG: hypothetical protein Ta2E_10800 [Mycoplasmoidaceae bacterium]